jgi:hypothetical protein
MACLFTEGFDKYGPPGTLGIANTLLYNLLLQEWTSNSTNYGFFALVPPLVGSTGAAFQFQQQIFQATLLLIKTFPGNYSPLIGGFRFQSPLGDSCSGIMFTDTGNAQCSIRVNNTGTISICNGALNGGVIATSTISILGNSINYLEWNISFGPTASYQVWLNGISVISGTGNTITTTNHYANGIQVGMLNGGGGNASTFTVDDIYIFDTTTAYNNAPLLTNPIIETQYASGDGSVAFTTGNGVLGQLCYNTANTNNPNANGMFLRLFTTSSVCVLNSVSCLPTAANATANYKAVVYATSGNAPTTLLGTGTQVTGPIAGIILTSPFSSGISLAAGTQYAIGYITDSQVSLQLLNTTSGGLTVANTYTSGAPTTAPAVSAGNPIWMIWGNISGMTSHYTQENANNDALSYNYSSTPGQSDLLTFPLLSSFSSSVYAVTVKASVAVPNAGIRTVELQVNSSGTLSTGNNGVVPVTPSAQFMESAFPVDPATGLPWTVTGVNNATSGVIVVT